MHDSRKIFSCIDLTSLNDTDNIETITKLCQKSFTRWGHVAAVCLYPQFVPQAAQFLQGTAVKIATVANFPEGEDSLSMTLQSIEQSIQSGAQEIDVVFPYAEFLKGNLLIAKEFVQACKHACGNKILKVILEVGAIKDQILIADASKIALQAGADFIKTSTGKISVGATLAAAETMLVIIRELTPLLNRTLGFKAAGGIRTIEQALQYVALAESIMGKDWVSSATFRIGASQLVDQLLRFT